MAKMTTTEKLLAADKGSLKRERKTKEFLSPSLSDLLGEDCYITIAAIDDDLYLETGERISDEDDEYNAGTMAVDVAVDSIIEPDFHNEKIYTRFAGALTPEDAVKAAFSAKELFSISTIAVELAGKGINEDEVEKVKN